MEVMINRLEFADFMILQEAALEVANRNPLLISLSPANSACG